MVTTTVTGRKVYNEIEKRGEKSYPGGLKQRISRRRFERNIHTWIKEENIFITKYIPDKYFHSPLLRKFLWIFCVLVFNVLQAAGPFSRLWIWAAHSFQLHWVGRFIPWNCNGYEVSVCVNKPMQTIRWLSDYTSALFLSLPPSCSFSLSLALFRFNLSFRFAWVSLLQHSRTSFSTIFHVQTSRLLWAIRRMSASAW